MSLMDKSVNFDSTNSGLTTAIYNIIKPIFTNANLNSATIYFDSNKKDGFRIETTAIISIVYIVQGKEYKYNYRDAQISNYSTLYYNISANKDMIAFGFTPGVLDFGMGYEESIGFWEFRIGPASNVNNLDASAKLFIKDQELSKTMSIAPNEYKFCRWYTAKTNFNISLIQLPLFVTSGNFNSLFEVISCNTSYSFNKGTVICSKNKYYRLLQPYDDYTSAIKASVILAMEVADD